MRWSCWRRVTLPWKHEAMKVVELHSRLSDLRKEGCIKKTSLSLSGKGSKEVAKGQSLVLAADEVLRARGRLYDEKARRMLSV